MRGLVVPALDVRRGLGGDLSFSVLMMYLIRRGFEGFGIGLLDVMSELYPSAKLLTGLSYWTKTYF